MNLKIVFYYLGWVLNIEAVLMLLPCAVSLIYGDGSLLSGHYGHLYSHRVYDRP